MDDATKQNPIEPKVIAHREFLEIASDFGNPLEVLREAISNSYDHGATEIYISFLSEDVDGIESLVVEIRDNGKGMSKEQITTNFWDLGNSSTREEKEKGNPHIVGEKGHGTKIYLRSNKIVVVTHHESGSFEAICERPLATLKKGSLHKVIVNEIPKDDRTGTTIRLEGYGSLNWATYIQANVSDYLYWYTKLGSFEGQFEKNHKNDPDLTVYLKCLDRDEYQSLKAGHPFADENYDLERLYKDYDTAAADHYAKKFIYENVVLDQRPNISCDIIISIEGDQAKRKYNKLIKGKKTPAGGYKVSDRYGLWLAKDYIPVDRHNEWVVGFGSGSNSVLMIHGFVNCQGLKLTANRGSVRNTDPIILEELRKKISFFLSEIDLKIRKEDFYTLQGWQDENFSSAQEKEDFLKRKRNIERCNTAVFEGITLLEPRMEIEVFGILMTLYSRHPTKFPFEPLDYNTARGIDMIAKNRSNNIIADCEFFYVEIKSRFGKDFNHGFEYVRWIVCWDFETDVKDGTQIRSTVQNSERTMHYHNTEGKKYYTLSNPSNPHQPPIAVIRLKEWISQEFGITFTSPSKGSPL